VSLIQSQLSVRILASSPGFRATSPLGASSARTSAFHASEGRSLGLAASARFQPLGSERYARLPVSKRMRLLCAKTEEQCLSTAQAPQVRSACVHNRPRCKSNSSPSRSNRCSSHRQRQSGSSLSRRLTLPSSGLAFGQPLKSNVRRLCLFPTQYIKLVRH
jgi:hypothetical protein